MIAMHERSPGTMVLLHSEDGRIVASTMCRVAARLIVLWFAVAMVFAVQPTGSTGASEDSFAQQTEGTDIKVNSGRRSVVLRARAADELPLLSAEEWATLLAEHWTAGAVDEPSPGDACERRDRSRPITLICAGPRGPPWMRS